MEIKNEYFRDNNRVWNYTPAFLWHQVLTRKWSFGWEQEFDVVSGASRFLGSGKSGSLPDIISGSSKVEWRHSESPSITYSHRGVTATAGMYSSRENDYFSLSPSASLACDFNERNTTVGISHAEFFDDFRPTGDFAGMGGKKRIENSILSVAQSLTPLTLAGLTLNRINSWGFLGHPYTPPMDANGKLLTEVVPSTRDAVAASAQLVQGYLLGSRLGSFNLDVRGYRDEWALTSLTADLKITQHFTEDTYFTLRGRYYQQSGAFFAKVHYAGDEAYRTADVRWFPFASYLAGARFSSTFPEDWAQQPWHPDRWDIKFDYLIRNTHGDTRNAQPGEPRQLLYQLYDPAEEYSQMVIMVGLIYDL